MVMVIVTVSLWTLIAWACRHGECESSGDCNMCAS